MIRWSMLTREKVTGLALNDFYGVFFVYVYLHLSQAFCILVAKTKKGNRQRSLRPCVNNILQVLLSETSNGPFVHLFALSKRRPVLK